MEIRFRLVRQVVVWAGRSHRAHNLLDKVDLGLDLDALERELADLGIFGDHDRRWIHVRPSRESLVELFRDEGHEGRNETERAVQAGVENIPGS